MFKSVTGDGGEGGVRVAGAPTRQKKRKWQPRRLGRAVEAAVGVPKDASQIRQLELVLVRASDAERMAVWNELIASEHELGSCRAVGRQLQYLVKSEHGWLRGRWIWSGCVTIAGPRGVDRVE